jgi:hypothetical protein
MKRSVTVLAHTPRAKNAAKNERAFAGRQATGQNPLPASTARRSFELVETKSNAQPVGQTNKNRPSQLVVYPGCQEIISVLRKKFLAQLKTKTSYLMAFAALSCKGHDYAFALNAE